MSSSDLSELSSSLSSDEDTVEPVSKGTLKYYLKGKNDSNTTPASPPAKKKRPPSPPHEYVLADNPDIAFICMFRSRFSDAFPKSLPHYGPQDIENGVVESVPGEQVERLLCALLGLVLNRKKDIERGHYTRALEEAIHAHTSQWPLAWQGRNPLHGGGSFNKMAPEERLTLFKALIIWSLGSSDGVQAIMKESYKRQRQDDDLNQPLSVQSWGRDGDKRRFWLVEGQDDTHFRLYRESNPTLRHNTWRSVAGTIDEVKEVAQSLGEESSILARRLRDRITAAIPRFEASEDKRKRRDYRLARRAQFTRPEPGFSMYEGRTRGKRMKYTYSDEEDGGSDAFSTRRLNRHSGVSTPAEQNGPTFTASGRQVRSRHGGTYGETMLSGQADDGSRQPSIVGLDGADDEEGPVSRGRPRRATQQHELKPKARSGKHIEGYNALDSMDDESDARSSGGEWDGGDDDEPDDHAEGVEDEDIEMSDEEVNDADDDEEEDSRQSLVVSLRYMKSHSSPVFEDERDAGTNSKDPSVPSISILSADSVRLNPPTTVQPAAKIAEASHNIPILTGDTMPSAQPLISSTQSVPITPNDGLSAEYSTGFQTEGHLSPSSFNLPEDGEEHHVMQ